MVYFFLTLIFALLMTLMFPLLFSIIIGEYMSVYVRALVLLISCFVIMCGYGYVITKTKRPRKPSGRMGFMHRWLCRLYGIC